MRSSLTFSVALGAAAFLALGGGGGGTAAQAQVSFGATVTLTSDQERLIPNNTTTTDGATGTGSFFFNAVANTLTVDLQVSNLKADITGAHIHLVADGVDPIENNGPVRFNIASQAGFAPGAIAGSGGPGIMFTFPTVVFTNPDAGFIEDLRNGQGYFNVHNAGANPSPPPADFTGGQIRGNITPSAIVAAPEPGTLGLLAGAAAAALPLLGLYRRSSRRKSA